MISDLWGGGSFCNMNFPFLPFFKHSFVILEHGPEIRPDLDLNENANCWHLIPIKVPMLDLQFYNVQEKGCVDQWFCSNVQDPDRNLSGVWISIKNVSRFESLCLLDPANAESSGAGLVFL